MVEIELKFQVPPAMRAQVARAVGTATAVDTPMAARYFDTPALHLARAGMALRLRREGRQWVQTLKGRGDGLVARLEHEVAVPAPGGEPRLDPGRHDGTPAGLALRAALGDAAGALALRYETRVRRTTLVLRHGGARIELALDVGELRAGALRRPLHELEFELQGGPVAALFDVAGRWAARHALWLDVRSKAERGERLAQGWPAAWPAATAPTPRLAADLSPVQALGRMLQAALEQALPNAAALADGAGADDEKHLHQWRVGLRRLRSLLRVFPVAPEALARDWDGRLARLASVGAARRDRQVFDAALWPRLAAAGAPTIDLPAVPPAGAVAATVAGGDWNALVLELLAFVQRAAADPAPAPAPLTAWLGDTLGRLHRALGRDARRYAALDDAGRHKVRKRLKRLRYAVEGVASLAPRRRLREMLAALKTAQDALGVTNDLCVAEALLAGLDAEAPGVWFARGWLAAQREGGAAAAARALAALAAARPCWPDGRER